jgi:hypothetical protein
VRTLSLWRPWPYTFVHGDKRIENRGYEITYRGDVCFHAARRFDKDAAPFIHRALQSGDLPVPSFVDSMHPKGVLSFVARIVDCVHFQQEPGCANQRRHHHWSDLRANYDPEWIDRQQTWAFGPWCTVVDDIRPFAQLIAWKGSQGWFDVPNSVIARGLSGTAAERDEGA